MRIRCTPAPTTPQLNFVRMRRSPLRPLLTVFTTNLETSSFQSHRNRMTEHLWIAVVSRSACSELLEMLPGSMLCRRREVPHRPALSYTSGPLVLTSYKHLSWCASMIIDWSARVFQRPILVTRKNILD